MKPKMRKALKRAAIISTGVFAFAGTVVGGYMVTPNRTKYIDVSVDTPEPTAFGQFVERITRDIGLSEDTDSAEKYLSATFDGLKITYKKGEDSTFVNTITLDGGVDFRMSALSLSGIEFSVQANANYNGKSFPVTLGHFHKDIYFGLRDMKMKFTEFSEDKLVDEYWYAFARYANIDFPQMLESLGEILGEKLTGIIDGLLSGSTEEEPSNEKGIEDVQAGGFDFASLLSSGPKEEHDEQAGSWTFTLGEEGDDICIKLITDEDFALKRVDLGTISAGGVNLSGAIDVDLKDYDDFTSPAASGDYIEVFNYAGLTHKLLTLLRDDGNHQKAGFEFALDLDNVADVNSPIDIAKIQGSMNIDFDELLDLSQYQIGAVKNSNKNEEEFDLVETIKKVGFNFQLDLLGQNDVEYANLDLSFAGGEGYIRFNEQEGPSEDHEAVMKLKMDTETFNRIVDKVPDVIASASGEETTESVSTLTDFLTDDLVSAVEKGDYSFVLDILETLENDENGIRLGLNLSQLGIGEDARVDIEINNDTRYPNINHLLTDPETTDEEKEAAFELLDSYINNSGLSIDVSNIAFGDYKANLTAGTAAFKEVQLGNKSNYQSVKFIPDIIDQVSEFMQTKRAGFHLNGSMKDSNGLGIDFHGRGQLDNNDEVKEGYGTLHFDEYKYRSNSIWAQHDIAVNVTNLAENIERTYDNDGNLLTQSNNNRALFVYGDPASKNVKGQLKLQSFNDILDIFSVFIDEYGNDAKFTKFLAPITEMLGFGALGDIINSKDYVRLASNELLKEVSVVDNGQTIRIVVSKSMLNLPSDITIEIGLKGDYDSDDQGLQSLKIVDFALGSGDKAKLLNMTFELDDYDPSYEDTIRKNDTYMDLNGIKVLLDLGINTTKANFYHLSANAHVQTILGIDIEISGINFYVYTDGEVAKVYGKIDTIPTIPLVTTDVNDEIFTGSKDMSCELSFETFNDGEHNDVAGMFNIRRSLDDQGSRVVTTNKFPFFKTQKYITHKVYHYRTESSNFLDEILTYLMGGVIGLRPSIVSQIGGDSSSSSSSSETPAGDFTNTFTDTGFKVTEKGSGMSKVYTIQVGLNLNELTGIDALREVEATIKSKRVSYQHNGHNQTVDILGSLDASLRVHFAVDINVSFTASVEEAQFDAASSLNRWNAMGQPSLTRLSGNVNGVNINSSSPYWNNANNPYTYSWEEILN